MRVQKGRRAAPSFAGDKGTGQARPALAAALAGAVVAAALGCALGPEQEPGCHDDADCGDGFTCRAGACFRTTTDPSPPETDAGDDAAGDAD